MANLPLISLFCGPGGLDLGFNQVGFQTLYASDISPSAVRTHRWNHPEANAVQQDIRTLSIDDLLSAWTERSPGRPPVGVIGGPPCQSFSYANTSQSEDDDRHSLPGHYARLLSGLNERVGLDFFVFENVLGLIGKHREKYEHFKCLFESAGFVITEQVLEAWQFGVPQLRPRVFVVGLNRDRFGGRSFEFPQPTHTQPRTVRDAIGHLRDHPPAFFTKELRAHPERIPVHPNHWTTNPKSPKFTDGTFSVSGKVGKSFAVLDWNKPSLTVAYGHREIHIHPDGQRRLSIFEAMLLQGFPSSYRMCGTLSDQITLVSEVVSPPVAKRIAEAIVAQLNYSVEQSEDRDSVAD